MAAEVEKSGEFRDGMPFLGGAPWLDLINSSFVLDGVSVDFLSDNGHFARWAEQLGFVFAPVLIEEERFAAIALRKLARAILVRLSEHKPLAREQVDQINRLMALRDLQEQLVVKNGTYALQYSSAAKHAQLAVHLASDLAVFLTDYEPSRLKGCDGPTCSMVFYDRGKNNRRRWCSMSICGNRDKVANYRARKAGAATT